MAEQSNATDFIQSSNKARAYEKKKNHIIDLLKESFVNIKAFKDINKIDRAIIAQLR